ncbi:MAG: ABC transporter permease [Anaerolineae bacterium]|nr:ABC transporter permease [Anaerolineae bacterium]MDW8068193.1 ABC transporter permease [Anaerolineae bacterium]
MMRPSAHRYIGLSERWRAAWRSFRIATWLGWQIESNWTDPFLFAVYSMLKPLASAAILVVMYGVITQAQFQHPVFAYIYLGNAFYIYVGAVMTGVSWAVIDDREHYRTLKYIYVAPVRIPAYWLGRGVARFLTGSFAVLITLTAGVLFLRVPLHPARVDWPLFLLSLVLGVGALALMGLVLASISLRVAHHFFLIGEAVAGALYLLSGAIFPLEVLPAWLRPLGFMMPITYWLELIRRSLLGDAARAFPTLAGFSNGQLLGILTGLSVLFALVAAVVFQLCDRQARDRGLIDQTTNY